MKKALVCGAGGFIGCHLVKKLRKEGYWVRGVDIKKHEWSPDAASELLLLDLRNEKHCRRALTIDHETFDEVYQLAADMGGMGFIHSAETEIMHNSALINIYMTDLAAKMGIQHYFFSSSVCVYRDMKHGEPEMTEAEAVPAHPDNEYGWEKLYSERIAQAYERRYGMQVRIARFQNCYGPEGAPGSEAVKKHRLQYAEKWPRLITEDLLKCGVMVSLFARTRTSATWWMVYFA